MAITRAELTGEAVPDGSEVVSVHGREAMNELANWRVAVLCRDLTREAIMANIRPVTIVVSNIPVPDVYLAKSYPDWDYNDNGLKELYRTPVYKVFLQGTDEHDTKVQKEWKALRFMPFWNDPKRPEKSYKARGWVNSGKHYVPRKPAPSYIENYEVHNTYSPFGGAIQIEGNFLIHAGPESVKHYGWGAAGCVEIIGNFDTFRLDIIKLSGSPETDVHKGISSLVKAKKLFVQVDLAKPPDLKSGFWGEVRIR